MRNKVELPFLVERLILQEAGAKDSLHDWDRKWLKSIGGWTLKMERKRDVNGSRIQIDLGLKGGMRPDGVLEAIKQSLIQFETIMNLPEGL